MRLVASQARRGFTLVELLVVLAIVSMLAGLLFPVFLSARAAAQGTQCLANFGNAQKATVLYATDYDDRLQPTNHRPGMAPDAREDRTWPQILLPYVRDFRVFDCPAEPSPMEFGGAFDPDLTPGDYATRYYQASLHSDLGYNAYYLSPTVRDGSGGWIAQPKAMSEVEAPSRALLYVESRGEGGGSYVVSPPCRYAAGPSGGWADTFLPSSFRSALPPGEWGTLVYAPIRGWNASRSLPYGGAWGRHNGRMNVARVDGSAKSVSLAGISDGCEAKPMWQGAIVDPTRYAWNPRG